MILVIGYGNELRGDDAVGPRVAAALAAFNLPDTRVHGAAGLTPELAEMVSQSDTVIFVDAALDGPPGQVEVTPCRPVDLRRPLGHTSDPESLLALAQAVFGRCPAAWLVKVQIESTELGQPLSAAAQRGIPAAVEVVARLVRQLGPASAPAPTDEKKPAVPC